MIKVIIVFSLTYLFCGFIFNLIISICHERLNEESIVSILGDPYLNLFMLNIVAWPYFLLAIICFDVIPLIIKKLYILFVAIIFLVVALFKKEK